MSSGELYGKKHRKVLDRLTDEWWPDGPPVRFVEGFPGVGKTNALLPHLRRRLAGRGVEAVTIEVNGPSVEDLLFEAPGEIEWHKDEPSAAVRAEDRERLEVELSRGAALVAAVGPRLGREAGNLLAGLDHPPPLVRLDPGLEPSGDHRSPPPGRHVLMLGRAEDLALIGVDIAAAAMALLPHPHPRPFESEPVLVVRGAPPGTGDSLRAQLLEIAGKPLQIRVREYTDAAERLTADLRRASLVLMPSRAEGFGLVGLEAIAAGVPVLVSDHSGLGELLRESMGEAGATQFVIHTGGELATDAEEWARAVEGALRDREAAFARAARLRKELAKRLSWSAAVERLLAALSEPVAPVTP